MRIGHWDDIVVQSCINYLHYLHLGVYLIRTFFKNWWNGLRFEPTDPRFLAGGEIKIAVIGGGTGLANLLRGLKVYSNQITAIVTVADDGGSTGKIRKEFDMLPPGDIRQCISALAYDEGLISKIFEFRFSKNKKTFGGHTLGNIWITALTQYYGSFDKAIEATTDIFQTAGKVLPATLDRTDLCIEYADGKCLIGESNLDKMVKEIKTVTLSNKKARAYHKAVLAIKEADLIIIGPGSLYGSIIPNLLISGIRGALGANSLAVKVYVANCSTERTQTAGYSVEDHLLAIKNHTKERLYDYCLVNRNILRQSEDESVLGEINNITTNQAEINGVKIVLDDVISVRNPLYHDSEKLAKSLVTLYNKTRKR